MVHLVHPLRAVRRALIQPPAQQREQRPRIRLRHDRRWNRRPPPSGWQRGQPARDRPAQLAGPDLVQPVHHAGTDQRLVEDAEVAHVVEQLAHRCDTAASLIFLHLAIERLEHSLEAPQQQVVLAPVVGIEGGSSNVGAVQELLDRDGVVALLEHEVHERLDQRLLGAAHPAVAWLPDRMDRLVHKRTPRPSWSLISCRQLRTMHDMKRDVTSGILLCAGALAGIAVMSLHPTPHQPLASAGMARLNVLVHGLALVAVPVVFLGLVGVARRLEPSDLTTAALVAWGAGSVAVMSAAVASGFVAPGVMTRIVAAEGSRVPEAFLLYTGLWNQGFAKVNVVAYAVGLLLWSAAILRSGRMARASGVVGAVVGAGVLLGFFSGHLTLDVHGFGLVTFAQSGWLIWLSVQLCREETGATVDHNG